MYIYLLLQQNHLCAVMIERWRVSGELRAFGPAVDEYTRYERAKRIPNRTEYSLFTWTG